MANTDLYRIVCLKGDSEWVQMHSIPTLQQAEEHQTRFYGERAADDNRDYIIELHPADRPMTQP